MIVGQAQDIASEDKLSLTLDECLAMEAGKTGALLSCAASIGAVLAGADGAVVEALADYGTHLGFAFQAIDDMLGVWGEPSVTGKAVGNDLRLRKKTLPISIANSKGFDIFTTPLVTNSPTTRSPWPWCFSMTVERVTRPWSSRKRTRDRLDALGGRPWWTEARTQLAVIAHYVVERDQ